MPRLSLFQKLLPLLSLIFLWPALLNGTPFFFADTSTYIREADAAVYYLTGHSTEWSQILLTEPSDTAQTNAPISTEAPASGKTQSSFFKNILLGRSIYYGFLIYLGAFLHSFWIPIAIQALIVGFTIVGAVRHLADPKIHPRRFAHLVIGANIVGALTPLPYYTSILMPDIFSGLLIVAAAIVAFGWQRETLGWRLFWLALMAFSALTHSTHVLVLGGLAVASLLFAWLCRVRPPWVAAGLILTTAVIGVAGEAAFGIALSHTLGRDALRPPFLSARLIADGPGAAYLRENCPDSGFAYCDYRDRISAYSDDILWSEDPRKGIFSAAEPDAQARLSKEDSRFTVAVLLHHPVWTLQTVGRNALLQLTKGGLSEFNLGSDRENLIQSKMPEKTIDALLASRGQRGEMPTQIYKAYSPALILLSFAVLVAAFFVHAIRPWRLPIALVLTGVIANAMICGAMSGAHERYQDRVMWLPIIAAMMVFIAGLHAYGRPKTPKTMRAPG